MKKVLLSVAILSAVCMINGAEVPGEHPFHQFKDLPNDLVQEILKLSGQGATVREYISSIWKLREVNKLWVELITPELIGQALKGEVEKGVFKQEKLEELFLAAARAGEHVVSDVLLNVVVQDTVLYRAAQLGHTEVVRLIIEKGRANVNKVDLVGLTLLMTAARHGHADVVQLLLDGGANIEEGDLLEHTALMWAVLNKNINVVRVLLNGGANIDMENMDGKTALILASELGRTEIENLLRQAGAAEAQR